MNVFLLKIIYFEDIFRFHSKCQNVHFCFFKHIFPLYINSKTLKILCLCYTGQHTHRGSDR